MIPKRKPVEALIQSIRGQRVILDSSLASLYGVTTARRNEQVRRNADRFPPDFMFRLTRREFTDLISQNATSKTGRGGRRKLPMAFTEHGAIMAANVLNSGRAIQMSVYVVRAFVRLRQTMSTNAEMAEKLADSLLGPHDPRTDDPAGKVPTPHRLRRRGGAAGIRPAPEGAASSRGTMTRGSTSRSSQSSIRNRQ